MKVLGIDTKSTGMHWVSTFGIGRTSDAGEKYGWVDCMQKNVDERRIQITQYAHQLFVAIEDDRPASPDPIHVFCEEPLALQNGKTTRLLGLAAGAIYGAFVLSELDATWHWVDQSTWKKSVLGRGIKPKGYEGTGPKAGWEKEWIREVIVELPGFMAEDSAVLRQDFDSQRDLYDAWAIKTYGVRALA
jgi:hypothetical protein